MNVKLYIKMNGAKPGISEYKTDWKHEYILVTINIYTHSSIKLHYVLTFMIFFPVQWY